MPVLVACSMQRNFVFPTAALRGRRWLSKGHPAQASLSTDPVGPNRAAGHLWGIPTFQQGTGVQRSCACDHTR